MFMIFFITFDDITFAIKNKKKMQAQKDKAN